MDTRLLRASNEHGELISYSFHIAAPRLRSTLGRCRNALSVYYTVYCPFKFELSSEKHDLQVSCTRRLWSVTLAASIVLSTMPAQARDRRNKKEIPLDDYQTSSEGIEYYDFLEGKGGVAEKGQAVLVHFDCMYRGIDAVSSRESKLLGGKRIIAQPYELVVGSVPGKERKREFVENANGLFSAQAAPKPSPALYSATEGMRVGGKVGALRLQI
ncbi:hypothetical protein L7F22_062158 [Adiantum nelumboides]|nr:hypothetical protein [Adiantum nelumboides]